MSLVDPDIQVAGYISRIHWDASSVSVYSRNPWSSGIYFLVGVSSVLGIILGVIV